MRIISICLLLAVSAYGQAAKSAPKPVKPPVAPAAVTEAEVNEFLRRMFGFNTGLAWTVQAIIPTAASGVTHVVATIGGQARPIHLYVLPGGKFAVAGEMVPFGADPFAPVRDILAAKAKGVQRGPATAAVTLAEFSDLQCPFCRNAQPIIDKLVAEIPEARLIFQPFPLPNHDWARKAAAYAECAGQQKPQAFWDFVNEVYNEQSRITAQNADEKLSQIATGLGLVSAALTACVDSPETYQRIEASIGLGKAVGVTSTPTLFINGRRVVGLTDQPYEQLKAIVLFELEESKKRR